MRSPPNTANHIAPPTNRSQTRTCEVSVTGAENGEGGESKHQREGEEKRRQLSQTEGSLDQRETRRGGERLTAGDNAWLQGGCLVPSPPLTPTVLSSFSPFIHPLFNKSLPSSTPPTQKNDLYPLSTPLSPPTEILHIENHLSHIHTFNLSAPLPFRLC